MGRAKIVYQNWIVELGTDPSVQRGTLPPDDPIIPNGEIIRAVRRALDKLPPFQKELIEDYYFRGISVADLAADRKIKPSEIQSYLREAIKSLKGSLDSFVRRKFGIRSRKSRECPICNSEHRDEINRLIIDRNPRETWKNVIKTLKRDFGIVIKTPQVLIGHRKYHIKKEACHDVAKRK